MLSQVQNDILTEMKQKSYLLATNEGSQLKCWLEDENGTRIKTVRVTTINALANAKVIAPLKDNEYKTNRNGIFLWKAL